MHTHGKPCSLQPATGRIKPGRKTGTDRDALRMIRRYGALTAFILAEPRFGSSTFTPTSLDPCRNLFQRGNTKLTVTCSSGTASVSASAVTTSWDPDEYMQSYDSDDYDDASYLQLQSKRVVCQHQAPQQLFETAADRRSRKSKEMRQVLGSLHLWCCLL